MALPGGFLRSRLHDPVVWNDVTQLLKTVLAAVLAWVLATEVFSLPQSFLAPWAALLVVHATVYRTFSLGLRQVTAAVSGVVLAWGVGNALGLDTASVAVVLALGLAIGAMPWFGKEATTVAATALVVLTTGFSGDESMLLARLGDTAIGIVVGLLVNAVVWPPLRRRTAIAAMDRIDDRIGGLLAEMALGLLAGCRSTTTSPTGSTDPVPRPRARQRVVIGASGTGERADEPAPLGPRAPRPARLGRSAAAHGPGRGRHAQHGPHPRVRRDPAVTRGSRTSATGGRSCSGRPAGRSPTPTRPPSAAIRERLNALVDDVGVLDPRPSLWPVYGGLMINLRNILDAMDEVAAANPLDQPPLPMARLRQQRRSASR